MMFLGEIMGDKDKEGLFEGILREHTEFCDGGETDAAKSDDKS
jgi:hypothetical protein